MTSTRDNLSGADFTDLAIDRAEDSARDWLADHEQGHPRTWEQEQTDNTRRGYEIYEGDFQAPAIAGYERLEKAGYVIRGRIIECRGDDRVEFTITDAGRRAIQEATK